MNKVEKFISQHKDYFKRNEQLLETNRWHKEKAKKTKTAKDSDEEVIKSKSRKEALDTDNKLVKNMLNRLSAFIKVSEGDRHIPKVQKFIDDTVKIIFIFINKCDEYIEKNDVTKIKHTDIRNAEIELQDLIFNHKIKAQDTLDSLDINSEVDNLQVKFYSDAKASLILKEPLQLKNFDIQNKIETLPVTWDVCSSKELFINMKPKDIPKWNPKKHFFDQDKAVLQFWIEEYNKIKRGININGYFVHPWLYFHLNFYKTPIPQKDGTEPTINPYLRDNEWFFVENLKKAANPDNPDYFSKIIMAFGTRRFSKSVIISSLAHWKILTKTNAFGTIVGGSSSDLNSLTSKIKTSLDHITPAFKLDTLQQNWESGETTFGIKDTNTKSTHFSSLIVQNLEGGAKKSSQKTAGLAPSVSIYDEALEENTLVYCEDREVKIKDIQVGDRIYDPQGKLTKVLEKREFLNEDLYEIEFNDGRKIQCTKNHLWYVQNIKDKKYYTLTTSELIDKHLYYQVDHRYNKQVKKRQFSIDNISPIPYSKKELTIDPYFLSLWLSDGFQDNTAVCVSDEEIGDYIEKYAESIGMRVSIRNVEGKNMKIYTIINSKGKPNWLREQLRKYGIFKDKRIPKDYLYSSVEQRMELLRGYLDADGYCHKNGVIEICITKNELHKDFLKLVGSLGIRYNSKKKNASYTYKGEKRIRPTNRVCLSTKLPIFKLSRKADAQKKEGNGKWEFFIQKTSIESIQKVGTGNAYCIKVDNESKLFVAGDYLPTHNCGKFPFLAALTAAMPSFATEFGYKAPVMLMGTSGESDLSNDAMEVLSNPELFNVLPMDWDLLESKIDPEYITWKRRTFGTFFPGQMAYEKGFVKKDVKFSEFLGVKGKELENINIKVTDWKKNTEFLQEEIKKIKTAKSSKAKFLEQQRKLQYPLDPEDCFMSVENNPFDAAAAKTHKEYLQEVGAYDVGTGRKVFLDVHKETGQIVEIDASEAPLPDFPFKGGFIDSPIVLYDEIPLRQPEPHEYIAGCLLPDEKVLTDKGLVSVKDVDFNYKLVNKEGDLVDIIALQRHQKKDEDVYSVRVDNTLRRTVFTKEHPIYSCRPDYYETDRSRGRTKHFNFDKFEFRTAEELRKGDWIKYPNIYTKPNNFDIKELWNKEDVWKGKEIDNPLMEEDFWYFIGLYLGDGWVSHYNNSINIAFNSKETLHIEKVKNIITTLFDRPPFVRIRNKNGSLTEISFSNKQLSSFLLKHFGDKCHGKYIAEWAKRVDDKLKYNLLCGYLSSDGCVINLPNGYMLTEFVSVSLNLLEDVQDILFSLGLVSSLTLLREASQNQHISKGRPPLNIRETYMLRMNQIDSLKMYSGFREGYTMKTPSIQRELKFNKRSKGGCFVSKDNKYIYFRVKEINTFKYTGTVYNFECETNTFLCKHITTHNCDDYKQESSDGDSVGSITIYKRGIGQKSLTIVAEYNARPDPHKKFHRQTYLLLKAFNAKMFMENEDMGFKYFLDTKNEAYRWLYESVDFSSELQFKFGGNRKYGWQPKTENISFMMTKLIEYCEEPIELENEQGETYHVLGLTRIPSIGILNEIINFKKDGNFDRLRSFGSCLMYSHYLDKTLGKPQDNTRLHSDRKKKKRPITRSDYFFGTNNNWF